MLAWWWLTVHFNYGGNWTALYCTGDGHPPPPELAAEKIYVFAGTGGFDGQFYHYLAHDPWLRQGLWKHIEAPRYRCRRILVPALAFLAAAGQSRLVDPAYLAVTLAFIFLGAYWVGRFLGRPGWGLAFLGVPSVLVSIDRLTVDAALATLCVGFLVYAREGPPWKLYVVLVAAGLARETGLLLMAACCGAALLRKQWRRALTFATAALPTLAWTAYVHLRLPAGGGGVSLCWIPLYGAGHRLLHPPAYPLTASVALAAHALDYLAVAGILLAVAVAVRLAWKRPLTERELAPLLFVLPVLFLASGDPWEAVYSFGRTLAPLPLLLALDGLRGRRWPALLPVAMVTPRVVLQLGGQVLGILRGLYALA